MIYIALPHEETRRLSFYLAMEEFVARHVDEDDCFFMWQVEPSVIFGRNQLIGAEVNLDFCRKHGIETFRRKSGGGCVYADRNNIMFSYITKDEAVNFTFNRYINMVVLMLHKLGVDAKPSGRNDIMIGQRKVSGNAFYHIPGRSIVHGTMLYDTNMENMVGAITPTDAKLLSKGISSVRQRVALLKDFISLDIGEFKSFVRKNLCDGELTLSESDLHTIGTIEEEYLSPEFIYGNNPKYTIVKRRRIDGVGDMEAHIELKNGIIKGLSLLGDYFLTGEIDNSIIKPLKNVKLEPAAVEAALPEHVDNVVRGLKKDDLVRLLTEQA